jgi:hypothetical protein
MSEQKKKFKTVEKIGYGIMLVFGTIMLIGIALSIT